jgi:hypothetical protein
MKLAQISDYLYQKFLSEKTKEKTEEVILKIALASFIIHLIVIGLVYFDIIHLDEPSSLLKNPIAAIYTPFSFILVYEVYLLVFYLPKSTSIYVSKQYENDLQFTFDLIAAVILFYLIYLFHIQRTKKYHQKTTVTENTTRINQFITAKKWIASSLVPLVFIIAIYSFTSWIVSFFQPAENSAASFKNINNIFFEQFFNVLIIADVILLLFSFFHTDEFHKVIRNSGFIISTILIRISFSVSGGINTILIVSAILFGLLMLYIHNKFDKQITLISHEIDVE